MKENLSTVKKELRSKENAKRSTVKVLKEPKDLKDTSQFPPECMTHNKC